MKKLVFGIDIGGTNTAFGLVDANGEIFGESAISTKAYLRYDDYPRYIEDLAGAMKALINSLDFNFELVGIGIGAPNANYYKGTVEIPSNMWKYSDEQIAAGIVGGTGAAPVAGGQPGANVEQTEALGGKEGPKEASNTKKARQRVAESTDPT